MIHRTLHAIEGFARKNPRAVFAVTALLVVGSLLLGRRLTLEGDILGFLPQDDPEIGGFVRSVRDFGSLDYLLVMLVAPPGESMADHGDVADDLAGRLERLPEVEHVEYRFDARSPAFRLLAERAPLFLDEAGLDRLEAALSDDAIREAVAQLRARLASPVSTFAKDYFRMDPLGLMPIYFARALSRRGALSVDTSTGTYLSADGGAQLLVVKPVRPPQDVEFSERLEAAVEGAFAGALAEGRAREAGVARPTMQLGGGYIIAIEDARLIKKDIGFNATFSFVAVVLLYLFCYRRLAAILYSVTPLLVGQALTFGVAVLVLGKLSAITAGFTAMLMGLGTDFTIVMYGRYVEERRNGAPLPLALRRMMGETALGVFTGAITSAGTFGAVCVTRFPGLFDFGFLVASGILICMVAILFLLPAMISWSDGRKEGPQAGLYLHSFGIERLLHVADRWPRAVLGACGVLTLVASALAWNLGVSNSYEDLRAADNRGYLVQEEVARRFGGSFDYLVAICKAPSLTEVVDRSGELTRRLDPFVESGALQGYDGLGTYVPASAAQRQAIARLEAGAGDAFSAARVEATTRGALVAAGMRIAPFEEAISALRTQLSQRAPVTADDLRDSGLARLLDRYVKPIGGEYRAATFLFPRAESFGEAPPPELVAAARAADPGVEITGLATVGPSIKRMFREDARRAFAIGTALVAILLLLDFRSLRLTIYGMAQLLVGVLWLLGSMKAFGIGLNFVNAFAITMILGVGIDYGIHLIHRIWEERSLVSSGVLETGKAVAMAALTNVAGFGTVALSGYPAIRSLGLISLIGTMSCLLTSLTLLPALLKLFPGRRLE